MFQDFVNRLRSRVCGAGIMQVIILAYQRSYDISDPFSPFNMRRIPQITVKCFVTPLSISLVLCMMTKMK
jgi:hypothetical protein